MLKRFYRRGFLTTQLCDHVISSSAFSTSVCRLQELHFCCFDLSENGPRQQMFFKTFSPLWFPHLSILDYPRTLDGKQLLTGRQIQILISFFFFFKNISSYCNNMTCAHSVPGQQSCINVLFLEALLTGQAPCNNIIQTLKPVGGEEAVKQRSSSLLWLLQRVNSHTPAVVWYTVVECNLVHLLKAIINESFHATFDKTWHENLIKYDFKMQVSEIATRWYWSADKINKITSSST